MTEWLLSNPSCKIATKELDVRNRKCNELHTQNVSLDARVQEQEATNSELNKALALAKEAAESRMNKISR